MEKPEANEDPKLIEVSQEELDKINFLSLKDTQWAQSFRLKDYKPTPWHFNTWTDPIEVIDLWSRNIAEAKYLLYHLRNYIFDFKPGLQVYDMLTGQYVDPKDWKYSADPTFDVDTNEYGPKESLDRLSREKFFEHLPFPLGVFPFTKDEEWKPIIKLLKKDCKIQWDDVMFFENIHSSELYVESEFVFEGNNLIKRTVRKPVQFIFYNPNKSSTEIKEKVNKTRQEWNRICEYAKAIKDKDPNISLTGKNGLANTLRTKMKLDQTEKHISSVLREYFKRHGIKIAHGPGRPSKNIT